MAAITPTTVNGIVTGDANFQQALPQAINSAELRIQRDLDLLPSETSSSAYNFQAGVNLLQISVNDFVTVQTIQVSANATTVPLIPATKEWIQTFYPDLTSEGVPKYFAPYGGDQATGGNTSNNFIVGPWPATAYPALITGTARLPSIYNQGGQAATASTATTFISTNYPDLLIWACLVYISAYQRNFGRQNDDPQQAMSYEGAYQIALKSALDEERRKKFQGDSWTAEPGPVPASEGRG